MTPTILPTSFRRRGFMVMDAAAGLFLIGLVATLLVTSVSRQQSASRRLGDTRDAMRAAEDALIRLQTGQPAPTTDDRTTFLVRDLPDASPVSRMRWIEISAMVNGRKATVTGLVPASDGGDGP
jgi:type II secretory pathway pseudopilin PulG